MSGRYECIGSRSREIGVVPASEIEDGIQGLALVLGDPEATALAVFGDGEELLAFLARARQVVEDES